MKKLFLVSLLLTGAGIAQAEPYRLVNADGAELSAVCIAAVTSREDMVETAAELGITPLDPATLLCNGMPVRRFVGKVRSAVASEVPASFVFSKTDNSPVTELCLAAVSSELEYMKVKEQHFSSDANVEAEVRCNGMPLKTFARKYGAPARIVSLR